MTTQSAVQENYPATNHAPCLQLADLAGPGITQKVGAGQTIVIEGDPIDHCYRILSGTVRLYKSVADGRRQIIDFLGPDDCFGMTGFEVHAYSVEAITDVVVIRYPRQRFDNIVQEKPDLGRQLMRLACSELNQAQQHMLMLGRKSADERVASFLLELFERQDGPDREMGSLHLTMSRQDIADHLGLTIETVSRIFTRFRQSGLIGLLDRHAVTLNDLDRLSSMAAGDLLPGVGRV